MTEESIILRIEKMRSQERGDPPVGLLLGPAQAAELRDALGARSFVEAYKGLPVTTHVGIDGLAVVTGAPYKPGGLYIANLPWGMPS